MVQITQFQFFPPMWHRSDMTHECIAGKKHMDSDISDQFQAFFICVKKSDMTRTCRSDIALSMRVVLYVIEKAMVAMDVGSGGRFSWVVLPSV